MAQPIPFQAAPKTASSDAERLRNAPEEHAEALLSAYEVLQLLHDKGVLNLLRGALGASDELVGMATKAIDQPAAIGGIRNFLLLTQFFASIPPEVLHSLVDTARKGAAREKAGEAPGLLQLMWRLRNKDSRHAAAVALDLLESAGKAL